MTSNGTASFLVSSQFIIHSVSLQITKRLHLVFLRLLEYFEGILILTTNRVGAFDPAFKSRIHLAIKYSPLTQQFRRDLWLTFIFKASNGIWPNWLDQSHLDKLSTPELNGRQIKNIVRTAQALSLSDGNLVQPEYIHMALTAMVMFESDFDQDIPVHGSGAVQESRSKRRRIEDSSDSVEESLLNL